jgi:hypothetical protein
MVIYITMSKPTNAKLYAKAKHMADDTFGTKTGAFKSMYIVKKYKELGGTYDNSKPKTSKLSNWRKEHWVDLNQPKEGGGYEKCGHKNTQNDKYPLCRPSKKVNEDTPKIYQSIDKSRINEVNKEKQIVKNKSNIRF